VALSFFRQCEKGGWVHGMRCCNRGRLLLLLCPHTVRLYWPEKWSKNDQCSLLLETTDDRSSGPLCVCATTRRAEWAVPFLSRGSRVCRRRWKFHRSILCSGIRDLLVLGFLWLLACVVVRLPLIGFEAERRIWNFGFLCVRHFGPCLVGKKFAFSTLRFACLW
jgi:hypothetical protein